MIRPAEQSDLPRLMGYAEQFLAYHPMTSLYPREPEAVEAMLSKLIADENCVLLVHDRGAIGGVLNPLWCAPSVKVATELFWWAEMGGRPLMKAFEDWARSKGADVLNMIAIIGRKDVTPLYDRAGYSPVELSFVRAA